MNLGKQEANKKKSSLLLNQKLHEKVLSRILHFDCEDILLLARHLSKLKPDGYGSIDNVSFA